MCTWLLVSIFHGSLLVCAWLLVSIFHCSLLVPGCSRVHFMAVCWHLDVPVYISRAICMAGLSLFVNTIALTHSRALCQYVHRALMHATCTRRPVPRLAHPASPPGGSTQHIIPICTAGSKSRRRHTLSRVVHESGLPL